MEPEKIEDEEVQAVEPEVEVVTASEPVAEVGETTASEEVV